MKAFIFSLFISLLGVSANASEMISSSLASTEMSSSYSPEVCQYSLTSYRGTIHSGHTDSFKVGLSCLQEKDVKATVVVFINDEHVASKVVTIKAGKDYSESIMINVGHSYNGELYKLVVQ